METQQIDVVKREELGKGPMGRLRREGNVPAVVYGGGNEAKTLHLTKHTFDHKITGTGLSQLFEFKSEDDELDGLLALIREVQTETISGKPVHIDFLLVEKGNKLKLSVPIEIIGEAPVVKLGAGVLSQSIVEVEVECLPKSIPSSLKLDISKLSEVGTSLHVSDLEIPEGVEVRTDTAISVVTAVGKQAAVEETPAEAEGEAAEGAPAEGGEAAPAAEEKKD